MFDLLRGFPPFLQYLICGTCAAILGFLIQFALPHREQRAFDSSLLVRYLALGAIVAGAMYAVFNHRDILHV